MSMAEHTPPHPGPAFATPERARSYYAAYDALAARWPAGSQALDLPSPYGTTRVTAVGSPDAPPLVLLHSGGAASVTWYPVAEAMAGGHRVYAVDQIGAAGRSVHDGRPLRTPEDLMAWLDSVLDGLRVDRADLCGHSYGAWLALTYALRTGERVRRLALLDPTDCFAGMRLAYRLRAVPLLLAPSAARQVRFLRWETGGLPLDEGVLALAAATAGYPTARIVMPRRPDPDALRALSTPTLVLLAGRSRSHDVRRVAREAGRLLPRVTIATLPGASHHSPPVHDPGDLIAELAAFLA